MNLFCTVIFIIVFTIFNPAVSLSLQIGPYTGQVVDIRTGEPVEGASVLCYWTKFIPEPMHGRTEIIEVKLVYTDREGRYNIPQISANLGLSGRLESAHVIIYQPGYQAYIVKFDYLNPYTKPDPDFKERDNAVKLDRIPPNFNHREHVGKIENVLNGIREYPYSTPQLEGYMAWEKLLEINLKVTPEKEEFLRRVEWEESRGMLEDRE